MCMVEAQTLHNSQKTRLSGLPCRSSSIHLRSGTRRSRAHNNCASKWSQWRPQEERRQQRARFHRREEGTREQRTSVRLNALTNCSFITGVIKRDRVPTFERLLWRLSRGKVYVRSLKIDVDEEAGVAVVSRDGQVRRLQSDDVEKSVFILFFSGEQLSAKVKKVCDGFRAHIYECPDNPVERAMHVTSLQIEVISSLEGKLPDQRHAECDQQDPRPSSPHYRGCLFESPHLENQGSILLSDRFLGAEAQGRVRNVEQVQHGRDSKVSDR